MSVALSQPGEQGHRAPARRRVRQEARDALAVALFSAGASVALALTITLLLTLVG
jgi:hypothetical protein